MTSHRHIAVLALALAACAPPPAAGGRDVVAACVADSRHFRMLYESEASREGAFTEGDLGRAVAYVEQHPDFTAYHLLFAVKARSPAAYVRILPSVRAAVLCSALANLRAFDDWGLLTVNVTDGPPGLALVELGDAARPCLIPLLHDRRPAKHTGSIEAMVASEYRRADYAYRYLSLILGRKPTYDDDVDKRDALIAALAAELSGTAAVPAGRREAIGAYVADSRRRITLYESDAFTEGALAESDLEQAIAYVEQHPDFTAYHLLFAVKARSPAAYARIPGAARAAVLCSALANLVFLNDWGHLDYEVRPFHLPALALLEAGDAARPCLARLLADRRPAPFYGSADATASDRYRRADFAYRYLSLILGREPTFDEDRRKRDALIDALAAELAGTALLPAGRGKPR